MNKNILWVLLLLASSVYATNIDTDFWDLPTYLDTHFRTDMQVTTDFTLSLVSGDVQSGDPDNLQGGDIVYENAVLRVTPSVNAIWAVSDLDVVSAYPTCAAFGYCPAMIDYSGVNTNRDVSWLSTALFDEHKSFGDANSFSQNTIRHSELGTFYNQPVTYTNITNVYHSNKRGGANVFCKGTLEVLDDGVVVGTSELPATIPVEFTVTGTGSHDIETRIADAECFGALEKHPLDLPTHPEYFYFFYFTHNAPPIPDAIGTGITTIDVTPSGGNCNIDEVDVVVSESPLGEEVALIQVTMHNYGDPITVTGVHTTTPGYQAFEFTEQRCNDWQLGSASLCQQIGTGGFDETISPGGEKDFYVITIREAWVSSGPVLTFTGQTAAGACNDDVDLTGPVFCDIDPPSLELVTQEVARFGVECYNFAHDPISCEGDDWYWNDGLVGGFVEKDNTHSLAYSTSSAGSSGTLNYESGIAHCWSDVDVRPDDAIARPTYACQLIPPGAGMRPSTSKDFNLEGFESGNPSEPPDASYDLIDGLTGALSNPSTQGVTYEAPAAVTSGNLRAYGEWDNPAADPVEGAVCFASIDVTTTIIDEGGEGEGASEFCVIGDGSSLDVYKGYRGWVPIRCGPPPERNDTCTGVHWGMTEGDISGNDQGASFEVTGSYGRTGYISAYVKDDPAKSCFKPFYIGSLACWEFS